MPQPAMLLHFTQGRLSYFDSPVSAPENEIESWDDLDEERRDGDLLRALEDALDEERRDADDDGEDEDELTERLASLDLTPEERAVIHKHYHYYPYSKWKRQKTFFKKFGVSLRNLGRRMKNYYG
ncbi:hypothetical protein HOLleu_37624 [Holothuria leucospilota]|uniref:Uncharacterized protein n=1 Tax=Holothuria leucospilota TaxID=206669 RepID=A0A9Q0YHL5_HOLLE|nr:hypothetical protein HOLleu_37624 [Holothuria leucospilota]